jgi:hypothetical protein
MRRLELIAGSVILIAVGTGPAHAVEVPSDLEFSYTMSQPLVGEVKERADTTCYQSLGETFTMSMQAGPAEGLNQAISKRGNEILCTIIVERILSNVVITGTAQASAQGQSGSGSFALTCEVGQRNSSFFSIVVAASGLPGFGPNPYGIEGNGFVSCAWTIAVNDAQKSQLAGSLEVQGTFSKDSERVSCEEAGITVSGGAGGQTYCVAFDVVATAFLTGATGAYAGRTGEGSLTQRAYAAVTIPLKLDVDTTCPPDAPNCNDVGIPDLTGCQYSATDPGTGGWTQWPSIPPQYAPPGYQGPGWYRCGGGSDGGDDLPPESTYDPSIPPCVPGEEGSVPPEGFSACVNPGTQTSSLVSALTMSVRAATGQALSLKTSKKAGTTRIVSPAKSTSDVVRPFGQRGASNPTVRLATVPGAVCAVTASSGSVKTTITAKGVAKGGQLDTKVTSSALMTRLKAAKGATATITAACSTKVGKRTVKIPASSVQVRFT